MPTALVTGSAGFIGYHTCRRLLDLGWTVVGLDAMTDYYDPALKSSRHGLLALTNRFHPVIERAETPGVIKELLEKHRPDTVIHLAAQAGVRYSIEEPGSYVQANILGTFAVLEAVRANPVSHLLIASTSSVYGANRSMPYRETDKADTQMSFYAATKKATEAMAHSYAHIYSIPITMFRFFTVYGPWGRPDMAPMKFARAMLAGEPIDVYNQGNSSRDFTYVDDLVDALVSLIPIAPGNTPVANDSLSPVAPFRVVNIGNADPVKLMDFIRTLEQALGVTAEKRYLPMQPGDVPDTWADTTLLRTLTGKHPTTSLSDGIERFVEWYRAHYRL